jgi:hypothetical protein
MTAKQTGGGGTAPAAGDREQERQRVYRRGRTARRRKEAGQRWSEPHYPADESDLAQAWLDGWQDMGDELARKAGRKEGGA